MLTGFSRGFEWRSLRKSAQGVPACTLLLLLFLLGGCAAPGPTSGEGPHRRDLVIEFPDVAPENPMMAELLARGGWSGGEYLNFVGPRMLQTFRFNCINATLVFHGTRMEASGSGTPASQALKVVVVPSKLRYASKRFHPESPVGGPGSLNVVYRVYGAGRGEPLAEGESFFAFAKASGSADGFAGSVVNALIQKKLLALPHGFQTPDGQTFARSPIDWNGNTGRPVPSPAQPPIAVVTRPDAVVPNDCGS